nr:unnamed protein product [Callosobruchus chinensis]
MECKPLDKRFKQKNDDDSIRVKSEHNAKTIYQKGTDMSKISPIVVLKKNYQGTKEIADIPKVSSICQKGTDIPKTSPIIVPEKNLQDNIGISYVPKVSTDRKKGTDITKMSPLVALKINVQDKTGTKISTVGTVGQKGTHMSRMLPKVVLKKTCTGTNDIPKVYTRAKTLQKGKNIYRKKTDIFNMCRVCLTQNPKTMYDLIEDFTDSCNKEISIIDALQTVTSTTIIIHPNYPQYICPMCLSMLKMAHEFILNFKKSLMQLEKTGAFGDDIGNKKKVVMNVEDTENWESNKNELLSDDNRDFEGRGECETQFNSLSELGREITDSLSHQPLENLKLEKLRRQLKMKGDIDSEIIIGKEQEADDNWKSGKVELIIEEEEFDTSNSDDEEDEGILEGHNLHDDDKITILMEEGNDEQTLRKKVKVASDEYKTVPDLEDTNCGETGRCGNEPASLLGKLQTGGDTVDAIFTTESSHDHTYSETNISYFNYNEKDTLIGSLRQSISELIQEPALIPTTRVSVNLLSLSNSLELTIIFIADDMSPTDNYLDKMFSCDRCGRSYGSKQQLTQHMSSHLLKKKFLCNLCGERFYQKNGLSRHMILHTYGRRYQCPYCAKLFR